VNPIHQAATLDPNSVSPGLLGFIIVVIIGLATWFLGKSMTKQLRKLDANRAEQDETPPGPPDAADSVHKPEPNGAH